MDAPVAALDLLDARLTRMERCVFGAGGAGTRSEMFAVASSTVDGGVAGRARRLHANLPSPPLFDSCVTQLRALKIDNVASLRRELSAPIDTGTKRALVLANAATLRRLAAGGEAVGELQGYVGGTAWHRARDELPRIARAEAASAEGVAERHVARVRAPVISYEERQLRESPLHRLALLCRAGGGLLYI